MDDNGEPPEEYDDEARPIGRVLAKAAAVVVAIGLLVFIGTTLMVKALGLDSGGSNTTSIAPSSPDSPLPSSALPVPGQSDTTDPTTTPSPGNGKLQLNVSPVFAKPMQRVNLTGTYPGHDAVSLQVQRFENGKWTSFSDVTASVDLGTFQTYIMTSHTGDNRFRVFDPQGKQGSNPVVVTIG